MKLHSVSYVILAKTIALFKAQNTLHEFRLSQMKNWHREAIAAISDWPRLFYEANLLSGTAENRAVCLGLKKTHLFHLDPTAF